MKNKKSYAERIDALLHKQRVNEDEVSKLVIDELSEYAKKYGEKVNGDMVIFIDGKLDFNDDCDGRQLTATSIIYNEKSPRCKILIEAHYTDEFGEVQYKNVRLNWMDIYTQVRIAEYIRDKVYKK